ncbi:MAG: metal ABC transporter solute-binding protein, Zn/Mn family [Treponema sp.]
MKKITFLVAVLCLFMSSLFTQGRLSIAVTFNAMEELTKAVVKDLADVSLIIPEGMEPHEAEPTPQNLAFLTNADVLIYNGLGMEFYLEKVLKAVNNKKLVLVEASKGIKPIMIEKDEDHDMDEDHHDMDDDHHEMEEEHHEMHHHHHHGNIDPHAWLSLKASRMMVKNIEATLSKLDKKNAKAYSKNANLYIKQLDKLFAEYNKKFKSLKNKTLVASHAAFAYLCRDFGLMQNSITDVFAEGEPNAKQLVALIEYCKEHNVKTIFSEEIANQALAQTLSSEVGGKVVKIYTMETNEENLSYLKRMEENLKRIYENLR